MDKIIKDYKKIYMAINPPMDPKQGFEDVLRRMEIVPTRPFFYSRIFLTVAVLLLITTGFAGAVFFAPPTSSLHAVKVAAQNAVKHTFNKPRTQHTPSTITPKVASPSPTLTVTPAPTSHGNSEDSESSSDKQDNKPNSNTPVKKIEGAFAPTAVPPQPNNSSNSNPSTERRNENANQGKKILKIEIGEILKLGK